MAMTGTRSLCDRTNMIHHLTRQLIAALLLIPVSGAAVSQPTSLGRVQPLIEDLARVAEAEFDCEISVLQDEPSFDSSARRWLAHYAAAGRECDDAAERLHHQGLANDILFSRRPTLDQLMTIIRPMIRSVESAFLCRITVQGTPDINRVSGRWSVTYLASGDGCDDAAAELQRQGRPLQISFLTRPTNQTLLR